MYTIVTMMVHQEFQDTNATKRGYLLPQAEVSIASIFSAVLLSRLPIKNASICAFNSGTGQKGSDIVTQ